MLPMFRGLRRSRFNTALVVWAGSLPFTPASVGAVPGDVVVMVSTSDGIPTGGTYAAVSLEALNRMYLFWRKLTNADMSVQISSTTNPCYAVVYRGISSISLKSRTETGSNPMTVSGFTPANNHAGLLCIPVATTGVRSVPSVTSPPMTYRGGFTFYYNYTFDDAHLSGYAMYEYQSPPNAKYAGQSFTCAFPDGAEHTIVLVELLV